MKKKKESIPTPVRAEAEIAEETVTLPVAEETLEDEHPTEESVTESPVREELAEATDPYETYRYRWEAGRKAKAPFPWKQASVFFSACILALGMVALCFVAWFQKNPQPTPEPEQTPPPASDVVLTPTAPKAPEDALTVQEMIAAVKPSVVGIGVEREDKSTTVASGIVVHADGYIITNRHVLEKASIITVHTHDGGALEASIIGSDELSDIAVLRVREKNVVFVPAPLGDSSLVRQGDAVVAIGTPGGLEFSSSATYGIVSGTERRVQLQESNASGAKIYTVIQTDASINPGNSGGPLVNVYGQVIGINSLKLSSDSYESIGFALPINGVISVANQIINTGRVEERPEEDYVTGATVIGATFEYFSALEAQESGLVAGAYVKTVTADGPAQTAGVKMGDIVTAVDDKPLASLADITAALSEKKAGEQVKLTVYREQKSLELTVTLAAYRG